EARFADAMREGLFAINVLAQLNCRQSGKGVRVLGRADHHGVDVFRLVVELPEIDVLSRLGIFLRRLVEVVFAYVTQDDDVLAAHALRVGGSASAGADDSDVQLFIESFAAKERGCAQKEGPGSHGAGFEEAAAMESRRDGRMNRRLG